LEKASGFSNLKSNKATTFGESEMERMTPEQQAQVRDLIKKIFAAIENEEDQHIVSNALAFCLFGCVKTSTQLSKREAVYYCLKHIKIFAERMWPMN
jgi:hypothetical protein